MKFRLRRLAFGDITDGGVVQTASRRFDGTDAVSMGKVWNRWIR
jgi:hypothetical protein